MVPMTRQHDTAHIYTDRSFREREKRELLCCNDPTCARNTVGLVFGFTKEDEKDMGRAIFNNQNLKRFSNKGERERERGDDF